MPRVCRPLDGLAKRLLDSVTQTSRTPTQRRSQAHDRLQRFSPTASMRPACPGRPRGVGPARLDAHSAGAGRPGRARAGAPMDGRRGPGDDHRRCRKRHRSTPGERCRRPGHQVGSHTDTVVGGGRFDGMVGVVGAIEAVRALRESGQRLAHDVVVVTLRRGTERFGLSCVGPGRWWVASPVPLDLLDDNGRSLAAALGHVGIDGEGILSCSMTSPASTPSSSCTSSRALTSSSWEARSAWSSRSPGLTLRALFSGRADHAGTMPMDLRRDAGCAAAGTVLAVERIAGEGLHGKGTSGRIPSPRPRSTW